MLSLLIFLLNCILFPLTIRHEHTQLCSIHSLPTVINTHVNVFFFTKKCVLSHLKEVQFVHYERNLNLPIFHVCRVSVIHVIQMLC